MVSVNFKNVYSMGTDRANLGARRSTLQNRNLSVIEHMGTKIQSDLDTFIASEAEPNATWGLEKYNIWVLLPSEDPTEVSSYRITGANPRFFDQYGVTRDDYVGHEVGKCIATSESELKNNPRAVDALLQEFGSLEGGIYLGTSLTSGYPTVAYGCSLNVSGKIILVTCGTILKEHVSLEPGSEFMVAIAMLRKFKNDAAIPSPSIRAFAESNLQEYLLVDYPRKCLWAGTKFSSKNTFLQIDDGSIPVLSFGKSFSLPDMQHLEEFSPAVTRAAQKRSLTEDEEEEEIVADGGRGSAAQKEKLTVEEEEEPYNSFFPSYKANEETLEELCNCEISTLHEESSNRGTGENHSSQNGWSSRGDADSAAGEKNVPSSCDRGKRETISGMSPRAAERGRLSSDSDTPGHTDSDQSMRQKGWERRSQPQPQHQHVNARPSKANARPSFGNQNNASRASHLSTATSSRASKKNSRPSKNSNNYSVKSDWHFSDVQTKAGPSEALDQSGSSEALDPNLDRLPQVGDHVILHSFPYATWLVGLTATVKHVLVEKRRKNRATRVTVVYDEMPYQNDTKYTKTVPMTNVRILPN